MERSLRARGLVWLLALSMPLGEAAAAHEVAEPDVLPAERGELPPPPTPSIAEDIEAMKYAWARAAEGGFRLVERGPASVAAIHAALRAPDANALQREQLFTVLGEIGDARSTSVIAEVARAHPGEVSTQQSAFRALGRLPAAPESEAFARATLDSAHASIPGRRSALVFFAEQRLASGRPYALRHAEDPEPVLRAAALYLAAALREPDAGDRISAFLAGPHPAALRHDLLCALAFVSTPAEFEARVPASLRSSDEVRSAEQRARFAAATKSERLEICRALSRGTRTRDARDGLCCLIEEGGASELAAMTSAGAPLPVRVRALSELRRHATAGIPSGAFPLTAR